MEDLPTPPLPEVTAMTRVSESGREKGISRSGRPAVEFFAQRLLLGLVHDAHFDGDVLDAVEGTHTLGDVLVIWVRSGHPAVVSRTLTATEEPSMVIRSGVTMLRSVMGRRISGSMTWPRASMTDSRVTGMDSTLLAGVPIF